MLMEFGKSYWKDYDKGSEREWILTNGIGGYASLSLIGSNNRRYHGLLVGCLKPPTSRFLLLANLLEDIVWEDGSHISLASFQTAGAEAGNYVNDGYRYLTRVTFDYLPEFTYNCKDIIIKKKIAMKHMENTTAVLYEIRNGSREMELKLTPLVNCRDHHHSSSRSRFNFVPEYSGSEMTVSAEGEQLTLHMGVSGGKAVELDNTCFYNMFYGKEQERGLDCMEDHYIPGYFSIRLKPWECRTVSFTASCRNTGVPFTEAVREDFSGDAAVNSRPGDGNGAEDIIDRQNARLELLLKKPGYSNELLKRLVLAADNFIVYRKSTDAKTVIAGYPWFTDWGRDTMIAYAGLTLATGRFEDAREILYTFSRYVDYGLIPNMFPDDGEKPAYNSVDAALWYFEAVNSYLEYTGDYEFIKQEIYPCLKNICAGFTDGTIFDIKVTQEGLVTAGSEKTQLTWMDAKVGDWVVTPRHGMAVEINALWYNGLRIMSRLAQEFKDEDIYREWASKAKEAFQKVFWNESRQCLYDVVNEAGSDGSLRPNQILAVGLSYPVLEGSKARSVVETVWRELYTPYGLRTLSQDSPQYRGTYSGDIWSRDGAYHQGTVWTWLLGRFVKAYVRINGNTEAARKNALDFILPFSDHIKDAGIGSISEIFDGNNPHEPRGCFAQAWSVAEILRAAVEDVGLK